MSSDNLISARTLSDIPKLEPGQSLLSPIDDRLHDPEFLPKDNSSSWPEWFKNRPRGAGTIGNCAGVQDVLSLGYTFFMPAPLSVIPDKSGTDWAARWEAPNSPLQVDSFRHEMVGECPATEGRLVPKGRFLKVVNPWLVKTAPGWSTLIMPPAWQSHQDWTLMPGVVNTDYYHHMNWVINIYRDGSFTIPIGTPIAHAITFPRNCDDSLLFGDERTATLLFQRGFGGPFAPDPASRRTGYRRQQRKANQACPVHQKQAFWQRLFSRKPNSKLV